MNQEKNQTNHFFYFIVLLAGLILSGCVQISSAASAQQVPNGDPERGKQALQAYDCQACHTIPGIPEARETAGPSLAGWAGRRSIAGRLPNTPNNLIRWLRRPQEIEPGTAMPDMGVTRQDARDMSAYLYTLGPD